MVARFENLDGNIQSQQQSFAFQSEAGRISPSERRQAFGDMALPSNKAAQDALPDGNALLASLDAGQKFTTPSPGVTRLQGSDGTVSDQKTAPNGRIETETKHPNGRTSSFSATPDGTASTLEERSPDGSSRTVRDTPMLNQEINRDSRGMVTDGTTTLKSTGEVIPVPPTEESPPDGFEADDIDEANPNDDDDAKIITQGPETPDTPASPPTSDSTTVAQTDSTVQPNTQSTTAT